MPIKGRALGAPISSLVFAGLEQGSQVAANFGGMPGGHQTGPAVASREAGLLPEPAFRSASQGALTSTLESHCWPRQRIVESAGERTFATERKAGNRVRVTAQLVEAATGNHVWAERYDRDLADIFAVQGEITERVVAAIEPELYAAEQVRSQSKPPDSLDAWECVIRALSLIGQGTRDENTEAEALCRRAIAIAPGYGRAHSLLAWALMRRTGWSGDL